MFLVVVTQNVGLTTFQILWIVLGDAWDFWFDVCLAKIKMVARKQITKLFFFYDNYKVVLKKKKLQSLKWLSNKIPNVVRETLEIFAFDVCLAND